jgi:hypothetical protein
MSRVVAKRPFARAGRSQQEAGGVEPAAGEHVSPSADLDVLSSEVTAREVIYLWAAFPADDLRAGEAGDCTNVSRASQDVPVFATEISGQGPAFKS